MSPSTDYPAPLVVGPKETHTHTFIILHGRGSTAEQFGPPLLEHPVSPSFPFKEPESFQAHFPHAKFIFPTASLRRAAAHNRSVIHQWFDVYPLDSYAPEYKYHTQLQGLKESTSFIHGLLRDAAEEVGAKNVVLVGISLGCATALSSLLLWEGENLGGVVGMCGWLPLRKSMLEALDDDGDGDENDVFDRPKPPPGSKRKSKIEQAISFLREELDLTHMTPEAAKTSLKTPIFMAHGAEDPKAPCELGRLGSEFLTDLKYGVWWKEYSGLGHWYSADMLRDIVAFVQAALPSAR
jgi:predicted esterase